MFCPNTGTKFHEPYHSVHVILRFEFIVRLLSQYWFDICFENTLLSEDYSLSFRVDRSLEGYVIQESKQEVTIAASLCEIGGKCMKVHPNASPKQFVHYIGKCFFFFFF